MNTSRFLIVPVLLLLAEVAAAAPDVQSTRLFLTRPDAGAPDLDATGIVWVRSYDGGDRERFDIRVHHVTLQSAHELWIDDGTGLMVFVADLSGGKSKKLSLDTAKGESLPLDLTLADLVGRRVEIQVNGEILLESAVPAFVNDNDHKFAKEYLDVAADSPNQGAQGEIRVKGNDQRGLQYLRLKAKDLGFQSFNYSVWVEDEVGTMVEVAPLEQYALRKGRLLRSTRAGLALPLGALYLSEIVGRKIEVRDQNGTVYLEEVIPPLQ